MSLKKKYLEVEDKLVILPKILVKLLLKFASLTDKCNFDFKTTNTYVVFFLKKTCRRVLFYFRGKSSNLEIP